MPQRFTIVDAHEGHLAGICAIYNQAVRETFAIWSETETTVDMRRAWMRGRRNAGFHVLAALAPDDGEVLGYASYGVFRDFPGYIGTVEHSVYVAPWAHRQGLGRALLGELVRRAQAAGLACMVGGVDSANAASIALHELMGFERQGCLKGVGRKFGRSLDLVFMVKALDPAR